MATLRSTQQRRWQGLQPSESLSESEGAFNVSSQTFPSSSGIRRSERTQQPSSSRHAFTSKSSRKVRETTHNSTSRPTRSHARNSPHGAGYNVSEARSSSMVQRQPSVRPSLTGNQLDVMTIQHRARYVASVAADCLQQMVSAELDGQDRSRWEPVWQSLVAIRQAYIFPAYSPPFPTLSDLIDSFDPHIQSSFDFAALGRANGISSLATFVYTVICPEEAASLLLEVESSEDDFMPPQTTRKGKAREMNAGARMAVKRRNRMLHLAWKKFWLVVVPLNLRSDDTALRLWLDFATQIYLRFDCVHVDHGSPARGLPSRSEGLTDLFSASAISRHGRWGAGPATPSRTETEEKRVVQARWKLLARRRHKELLKPAADQKFPYTSFRQNMIAFIESAILPSIVDSPTKAPLPLVPDSETSSLEDTDFENRPLGGRLNARHDITSSASNTVSDSDVAGAGKSPADADPDDQAFVTESRFDRDMFAELAAEMEAEELAATPRARRVIGLGLDSEQDSERRAHQARNTVSRSRDWNRPSSSAFDFRRRQSDAQQIAWDSPAESRENTPRSRIGATMRRDIAQMTTPRRIRDPSKTPQAYQHLILPVSTLRQSFSSPRSDSRLSKRTDKISRRSLPPPQAHSSSLHVEGSHGMEGEDNVHDLLPSTQDMAGFGTTRETRTPPARESLLDLLPSTQDLHAIGGPKRARVALQHVTPPPLPQLDLPSTQSLHDEFGPLASKSRHIALAAEALVLPHSQDLLNDFGQPHSLSKPAESRHKPPFSAAMVVEGNDDPTSSSHKGEQPVIPLSANTGVQQSFAAQPPTVPSALPQVISSSFKTRDRHVQDAREFASPDITDDQEDRALIRTPTTPMMPLTQMDLPGTQPESETGLSVRRTPRDLLALPSPARSRPLPVRATSVASSSNRMHTLPLASSVPNRASSGVRPAHMRPTPRVPDEDLYLVDADSSPLDPDPNFVIPRNHVAHPSTIHGRIEGHLSSYCRISGKRKWTRDEELLLYRTVQKVPMSEEYPLKVVWYLYGEHGVVSHMLEQFNPQHMKDKMRVIVNRRINNRQPVVGRARHWLPTWHDGKAEYMREAEEFWKQERAMHQHEDNTDSDSTGPADGPANDESGEEHGDDVFYDAVDETGQIAASQTRHQIQRPSVRDNVIIEIPVRPKRRGNTQMIASTPRERRMLTRASRREAPPSALKQESRPDPSAVPATTRRKNSAQNEPRPAPEAVQRARRSAPLPKRKRPRAVAKAPIPARQLRSSAPRSPVLPPNVDSGSASPARQGSRQLGQIDEEVEDAELDQFNSDEEGEPEIDSQADYIRVRHAMIRQRVLRDGD